MKLNKDLPQEYCETYMISPKDQTIIIEMSFIVYYLLDQVRMPMVTCMLGGDVLIECFQNCLAACILTLIKAGLITQEYYVEHRDILDEQHGIKENIVLDTMGVSDLAYDTYYMINQYMVVLGHESPMEKKDDLYGNQELFRKWAEETD